MDIVFHVKCSLFLSGSNEPWTFLTDFGKMLENEISRISVQSVRSFSMPMDWRTNRHNEANSSFSQFSNVPKNESYLKPSACLSTQCTLVVGAEVFCGTLLRFYGTQSIEFQTTEVLILRFTCCVYFIKKFKNDLHLHYERKLISFFIQTQCISTQKANPLIMFV